MNDYDEGLIKGQLIMLENAKSIISSGLSNEQCLDLLATTKKRLTDSLEDQAQQYEADAKADNLTGQIPNV